MSSAELSEIAREYESLMLKRDSRLASGHLGKYVSLFQPATVVSSNSQFDEIRNSCFFKKFHQTVADWNTDTYFSSVRVRNRTGEQFKLDRIKLTDPKVLHNSNTMIYC